MKDLLSLIGVCILIAVGVVTLILAILGLISLPFAFMGWVVTTIIGMFMVLSVSYLQMVAVGLGTSVAIGLIKLGLR